MMETLNDPDRQTRVLLAFLVVVGIVLTVVAWFQLVF
jgi:hypothetical protein